MPLDIKDEQRQKRIVQDIIDRIDRIKEAEARWRRIAIELYKNYNSIVSKRFYKGRSNIFVPLSFQVVETLVAFFYSSIFNEPIPFFMEGTDSDDRRRSERVRGLLWLQARKFVNIKKKMLDILRSWCIYGRVTVKIVWRTEYRTITKLVVKDQELSDIEKALMEEGALPDNPNRVKKLSSKEVRVPIYDCWDIVLLDYFDMFVDPDAPDGDIQRASFVFHRSLVGFDEIRDMWTQRRTVISVDGKEKAIPVYENFIDLKDKGEGRISDETKERKSATGIEVDMFDEIFNNGKKHEILEGFMDLDLNGNGEIEKNVLVAVLNRRRLIRAERNPWWHGRKHFISSPYYSRPNEVQAQGPLHQIRRIQYEVNDKRNQSLDYATMSLNAAWIVGDGAGLEKSQIRLAQNGVVSVRNIDQIKQIIFPDLTNVATQAEALMDANIRETTGATRAVAGAEGGPKQTASQFTQLLQQALGRNEIPLETLSLNFWQQLWEIAHALNQQFIRESVLVKLTMSEMDVMKGLNAQIDDEGNPLPVERSHRISPEELAFDADFIIPTFADVRIRNLMNQNLITFLEIVKTMPETVDNQAFFNVLIRKIWSETFKFPREELFKEDSEDFFELTHPGARSIFDQDNAIELQNEKANQEAQKQLNQETAAAQGQGNGPGLDIADDLSNELGQAVPQATENGGIQIQ